MVRNLKKLSATLFAVLLVLSSSANAQDKPARATKLVPEKVGEFKAASPADAAAEFRSAGNTDAPSPYGVEATAGRTYAGPNGEKFRVGVAQTASPAAAFSLLQHSAAEAGSAGVRSVPGLGLQGFEAAGLLEFAKGSAVVRISADDEQPFDRGAVMALARPFAEKIEGEANYVPVLLLHLPEWEKKVGDGAAFAVTLPGLQNAAGARPVFDALSFEGGAEAVTAPYGGARLVIVEFSTPQHSVENDARVNERMGQLAAAGQPIPSFYQRVGNYSVFVFDAPNEAAARTLASGVKYEKDVRWLGRNPREGEKIERYVTQTMGGAIVTALLTTGAAILASLGIGGLIGGAIFVYRRTRPGAQEAYSDAGGMMRLNLEDLDPSGGTAKMLGPKQD